MANQRWRHGQFAEAWALSRTFRGVVEARRAVDPANGAEAVERLRSLTAVETAYRQAETRFNSDWGAYGLPVAWGRFAATNPRPLMQRYVQGYYLEDTYDGVHHVAPTDLPEYKQLVRGRVLSELRAAPLWYAGVLMRRVIAIQRDAVPLALSSAPG